MFGRPVFWLPTLLQKQPIFCFVCHRFSPPRTSEPMQPMSLSITCDGTVKVTVISVSRAPQTRVLVSIAQQQVGEKQESQPRFVKALHKFVRMNSVFIPRKS